MELGRGEAVWEVLGRGRRMWEEVGRGGKSEEEVRYEQGGVGANAMS